MRVELHRFPAATSTMACRAGLALGLALAPACASAQGASWRIQPTPEIRLGYGDVVAASLTAPVGASRLPNGNTLVGDRGDFALVEYSPKGEVLRKSGRKGKGPGEVTFLMNFLRCGDSLVTLDFDANRASVLNLEGKVGRTFRLKQLPYRSSCNARMQFLFMDTERNPSGRPVVNRPLLPYRILPADSSAGIALGDLPGIEQFGPSRYPLGRDPRVAIGRTRAYIALADSFEIRVFDMSGKPLPSYSLRMAQVEATQADLDAFKEDEIATMGEKSRPMYNQLYAKVPLAKYLPATRDLIVDADDNLWVQHYPRASSPLVRWTVFSPVGKVLATIALPRAFELYEAGRDYVLGRYIDPNESIPEVRLYRVTKY
ncbi:MAG: hypothetical protein ABMA00_08585 [Gemmatimonas sp.]